MSAVEIAVAVVGLGSFSVAGLRWLRVAQREHYLPGSATRFAWRWWRCTALNAALLSLGVVALAAGFMWALFGLVAALVGVIGPLRLGVRGRTSKLAWTRRLRTLAVVCVLIAALALVVGSLVDRFAATSAALALAAPVIVDLALAILAPVERRLAARYIAEASDTLARVAPKVVAITGSYGKTTTKQYARHLLSGRWRVVASPASFNNSAGLSRAINEHLTPGTEIFIAEMGTYGPGEIEAMSRWIKPTVGVITAIGPVHLERMKTLDGIVEAKAEILETAETAVLNVDAHGLASLADRARLAGLTVLACSARPDSPGVDVRVTRDGRRLTIDAGQGRRTQVDCDAHAANLACAVAVAVTLDLPWDEIVAGLESLPRPEHRQAVAAAASGVLVIDNTFSSNPASAASSLDLLERTGETAARRVVVTPGMVELGPAQESENQRFAAGAAAVADDVLVVGHTNRRALLAGMAGGRATSHVMATREDAVRWVRAQLAAGDVVLYENDLPDHYP
jgi:UDP-N-acetylmuramoyl-tripeptide--D-alanyl-D-alanine ligase